MKTTLLYIIGLTLMCLALTAITFAAPMIAPVRYLIIPGATGIMDIDGVADDYYSAPQSTTAFNATGSTGADADFTATFQVCWNTQKLYLLATILDDYACEIPYTTSTNSWTWDNIEVFLSLDTTSTTPAYDSNTAQLRFNRGIQDSAQTPGRAAQENYEVYYENTADGWVIEVGIPWTAVLQTGAVAEDIMAFIEPVVNGFDFSAADNDSDGADARDCQVAWDDDDPGMPDATEDLAWNNRTMFGIMTLYYGYDPGDPIAVNGIKASEIKLTPNPAANFIRFDKLEGQNSVVIISISGTKVLRFENIVKDQAIDISRLPAGIYTVLLNNEETLRFVKE